MLLLTSSNATLPFLFYSLPNSTLMQEMTSVTSIVIMIVAAWTVDLEEVKVVRKMVIKMTHLVCLEYQYTFPTIINQNQNLNLTIYPTHSNH
jgi:hypothetical protein